MRTNIGRKFTVAVLMMLMIFLMGMFAQTAYAAAAWKAKYVRFSATAGETLATGNVVAIKGSDGKAYQAAADSSTLRPAVGVIDKGGATGATVEIVVSGVIDGMTARSPGARLFLANSDGPGTLQTTAPTYAQPVGFVMPGTAGTATSTKYFINLNLQPTAGAGY